MIRLTVFDESILSNNSASSPYPVSISGVLWFSMLTSENRNIGFVSVPANKNEGLNRIIKSTKDVRFINQLKSDQDQPPQA
jgi:hypothetical protein